MSGSPRSGLPDCSSLLTESPPQLCEDLFSRINDTTNDNMSYSVEVGLCLPHLLSPRALAMPAQEPRAIPCSRASVEQPGPTVRWLRWPWGDHVGHEQVLGQHG